MELQRLEHQLASDPRVVEVLRRDPTERLKWSEGGMALLLQLDSMQGVHPVVRDNRKSLTKDVLVYQEYIDSAGKGDTHVPYAQSAAQVPPPLQFITTLQPQASLLLILTRFLRRALTLRLMFPMFPQFPAVAWNGLPIKLLCNNPRRRIILLKVGCFCQSLPFSCFSSSPYSQRSLIAHLWKSIVLSYTQSSLIALGYRKNLSCYHVLKTSLIAHFEDIIKIYYAIMYSIFSNYTFVEIYHAIIYSILSNCTFVEIFRAIIYSILSHCTF